jgi:hypothetical protein
MSSPSQPERSSGHRRKFTPDEDQQLRRLVEDLGTKSWDEIAGFLPDRNGRQCRDRYRNYLLKGLITEPWTPKEDATLISQYHLIGPKWVEIGKMLSGRSGNNVKNRWHKHLCRLNGRIGPPEQPAREPFQWTNSESALGNGFSFEDWLF